MPHNPRCAAALAAAAVLSAATLAAGQALDPAVFTVSTGGDALYSQVLGDDGTLTNVDRVPTGNAPQSIALSPDGAILAVGHGTQNNVVEELRLYRVNADATFTALTQTLIGDSPLDLAWLNNDVLAATATDFGSSPITTYRYDRAADSIAAVDSFSPGSFAASLAVGGDFLFTETSFQSPNNSVVSRRFDADGNLSGGGSALVGTGSSFATDLAATDDGRFLYGAGGISGPNDDEIYAFEIDPSDGSITAVQTLFTGRRAPAELALSPDGGTLYASFNGLSNGTGVVVGYAIDPSTGTLSDTGNVAVLGDRGDANAIDALPGFVFNLDGTGADSTRGVEVIEVATDGRLRPLATFGLSDGSTPDALAVWRGIPEPTAALSLAVAGGLVLRRRR